MTGKIKVIHEVKKHIGNDGWDLCFQYGLYQYKDGQQEEGYRFIWRRPDGSLQAARGQARILSIMDAHELIDMAVSKGWGDLHGKPPIVYDKE